PPGDLRVGRLAHPRRRRARPRLQARARADRAHRCPRRLRRRARTWADERRPARPDGLGAERRGRRRHRRGRLRRAPAGAHRLAGLSLGVRFEEPMPAAAGRGTAGSSERRRRVSADAVEVAPMARKKRPSKVRPKSPARIRKKTRRRRAASHQHPELIGLGLAVFGVFMGSVLYAGWNGGFVGRAIGDGLVALVGDTAYVLPVACAAVGLLMVGRSNLPRFAPFRTGLLVTTVALGLDLGRAHGGYFGRGLA